MNIQKPPAVSHRGIFQDFSIKGLKHSCVNCSGKTDGQSHKKIQPCLQHGAWHPEGHILSLLAVCTGVSLPCSNCLDHSQRGKQNGSTNKNRREKHSLCTLIKKNMPFFVSFIVILRNLFKKLKTVTILIEKSYLLTSCSKYEAISIQLQEDGLINRMLQSMLNHNCFSGL